MVEQIPKFEGLDLWYSRFSDFALEAAHDAMALLLEGPVISKMNYHIGESIQFVIPDPCDLGPEAKYPDFCFSYG
ncbi:hypothetical protein [uncultured Microbulbifer sp.]|uniref:hypothetical protein n=1 Tax=uncultured Microbulbifer sp. TaxID=348147 RepID=UPI00261742A7|nr:hypothetical protein [uncultured Microbulbifer sp.]